MKFFFRRQTRLREAYYNVFLSKGAASVEDQEMVLADILTQSGFSRFSEPPTTNEALWFQEGKRALYGHIKSFLTMSDENIEALEVAAREEAATNELYQGLR